MLFSIFICGFVSALLFRYFITQMLQDWEIFDFCGPEDIISTYIYHLQVFTYSFHKFWFAFTFCAVLTLRC